MFVPDSFAACRRRQVASSLAVRWKEPGTGSRAATAHGTASVLPGTGLPAGPSRGLRRPEVPVLSDSSRAATCERPLCFGILEFRRYRNAGIRSALRVPQLA